MLVEDERPARPPFPPRARDRLAPWAGLATLVTIGVGVLVCFRPQSDPPIPGPPLAGLLATAAAIVVWITAGALGIRGAVLAGLGRRTDLQVFRGLALGPRGAVWVPIAIFCGGLALREVGGFQFGLSVETSKAESHQQTVFRPLAPSGDETVTTSQPPAVEITGPDTWRASVREASDIKAWPAGVRVNLAMVVDPTAIAWPLSKAATVPFTGSYQIVGPARCFPTPDPAPSSARSPGTSPPRTEPEMLTVADGTVTGTVEIESIGFCSIRAFREKTAAVAAKCIVDAAAATMGR